MSESDDHDLGLPHDLAALLGRRKLLTLMASAGAAGLLSGCDAPTLFSGGEKEVTATRANGTECIADPAEVDGPYPADGSNRAHGTLANVLDDSGIVRRDMRPNFGGAAPSAAPGAALDLTISLVNVHNACAPVQGYAIYVWHCDAAGRYSIYDVPDATYLRAVGETDAEGKVTFTTIVPGCYQGRYPHIHFEVYPSLAKATGYRNRLLTSQLAIPAEICKAAYGSDPAYKDSAANFARSTLEGDMIFADNTPKQLAAQTPVIKGDNTTGYRGEVTIGLKIGRAPSV